MQCFIALTVMHIGYDSMMPRAAQQHLTVLKYELIHTHTHARTHAHTYSLYDFYIQHGLTDHGADRTARKVLSSSSRPAISIYHSNMYQ